MTGESQHSQLGGLQNRTTKPPASINKETKKRHTRNLGHLGCFFCYAKRNCTDLKDGNGLEEGRK